MIWKLIPKKVILYIVAAAILLGVGAFGGYTFCKRAQYKGVIKQQQKDADAVLEHQEKKDVVEREVIKYIEVIKRIPDKSGCLDKPNDSAYIDRLLESDSDTQSSFN